ncbi:uncharacterized protein L3040_006661 [Drepanopeziza brunnea f. sp. 'multigermtubi']|uniref:Uncharacterized protein n=1 Tax=Marssonina brunnea f. sp. multigermtubi (strain MB_m1) TaxID=1072389 RepID=K1XA01_MARBU|nr:uncharacterized protein MBM_04404 [Drepanopeziza brunnea f. sp. 'multigermtubi' MB_m1]EKD17543.1 hypothetical protein MBM_04404 [Drepanopeziza brunnea f. sp. 'multigermtubi' MB_m1]KAJ5038988.1 hypothetical protein L3040_006661 [Drepanopeziza brunnea f. sp. 'multigermtubi']
MPPLIKISIPEGTKSIDLTALSLYEHRSQIIVEWTDGSANFGATFVGPTASFVLADKAFGQPIISLTDNVPKVLSVSFKFYDMTPSILEPKISNVGPQGNGTQVQITGYASSDKKHEKPTTLTVLFKRPLRGIKRNT